MKKTKKLILHRESVRRLERVELEQAPGGGLTQLCSIQSCIRTCVTCPGTCTC